jgi:hypothetical protein
MYVGLIVSASMCRLPLFAWSYVETLLLMQASKPQLLFGIHDDFNVCHILLLQDMVGIVQEYDMIKYSQYLLSWPFRSDCVSKPGAFIAQLC